MSQDEGYSLPQMAVRKLVRLIQSLDEVARHFEMDPYLSQGIRFLTNNTKRMLQESSRELWKKTNIRSQYDAKALSHDVSVLVWVALSLGRIVNQYRALEGQKPIDWVKAAEQIDRDEKQAERRQHA